VWRYGDWAPRSDASTTLVDPPEVIQNDIQQVRSIIGVWSITNALDGILVSDVTELENAVTEKTLSHILS
jgi:hypothetical protein